MSSTDIHGAFDKEHDGNKICFSDCLCHFLRLPFKVTQYGKNSTQKYLFHNSNKRFLKALSQDDKL